MGGGGGGGGRGLALYSQSIFLIMPMTHLHTGRGKAPEGGVVGQENTGRVRSSPSKLLSNYTEMETIEGRRDEVIVLITVLCQRMGWGGGRGFAKLEEPRRGPAGSGSNSMMATTHH